MARMRPQTRIIALAGPKGGIGRSTCTVVLARALAAREHEVLIVDSSPYAGMATMLDLERQTVHSLNDVCPAGTSIKGVNYVCINDQNSEAFCSKMRELTEFDDIVIDLAAGIGDHDSDIFLHADLPVIIADPEPVSIQMATLWLRLAFVQSIRRFEENAGLLEVLEPQKARWTFNSVYQALHPHMQSRFISELAAFRCVFLLNHRRENSESLQARALCHAWGMTLGLDVHYLGSLPFDERRWFFARQLADVSNFVHEDPLVREMDSILRDELEKVNFDEQRCLPVLDCELKAREFLGAGSPEEARMMYRLLWEGYRRENGLVANVLSREDIAHIISQLEIAYRHSENEPNNADSNITSACEVPSVTRSFSNSLASAGTFNPDKCQDNAGIWLKEQRELACYSIEQLAFKSRISSRILENLESCALDSIPVPRLQAYLFELAKILDLDFDEVKAKFGLTEARTLKSR